VGSAFGRDLLAAVGGQLLAAGFLLAGLGAKLADTADSSVG
jgi:hypothetical protein